MGKPVWNRGGGTAKKWEYLGGEYKPVQWFKNRPQATTNRTEADHVHAVEHPCLPAIIPQDIWDRVQANLKHAPKKAVPKAPELWLSGLLVCGNCTKRMVGQRGSPKSRKWPQFICGTYHHKGAKNEEGCGKNSVKLDRITEVVNTYLNDTARETAQIISGDANDAILTGSATTRRYGLCATSA